MSKNIKRSRTRHKNCYCSLWQTSPDTLTQQGVKPGYCGICSLCGEQGHLRHAPGFHPYTDAWCDSCFKAQSMVNGLQCLSVPLAICSLLFSLYWLLGLCVGVFVFTYALINYKTHWIRKIAGVLP
ncbi:hypothetical protein [Motilimonas pumila]|uniref:Uncharacterized protein n=1 Tax=Motilimonas pumila TaxID=2303987 RepID=A0A418YEI8_9GAMM|nr:hypothetical protein [Motilimonas pumila]RJG47565.1 hypothetical protein D1Z90_10540 [Motilimonas pumila]